MSKSWYFPFRGVNDRDGIKEEKLTNKRGHIEYSIYCKCGNPNSILVSMKEVICPVCQVKYRIAPVHLQISELLSVNN